jgi:hypothetical protein
VGDKLLALSDALSHAVLRGGGDDAKQVLKVISTAGSFSGQTSFVVALLGLLCIVAALFVWIELVVRSALIYLLVALSPLVFAAMVWPAARGMVRKLTELLLALIFSKVVIAIAFSVGAAALAGVDNTGHADAGATSGVTASAGTLFSGLVIFALAAFAPFVVLKLFPAAEAAVVAQGISRGPVRATQQASASAFYIERLAGAHSNGSHAAHGTRVQAGGDYGAGPTTGPSPNGGGPGHGPGPGRGPGAVSSGSDGGATAAAGPAAAALAAAEVGRGAKDAVTNRADGLADAERHQKSSRDAGRRTGAEQ